MLLTVRANTSLESSDPAGDNPGEPYFVIKVDGEQIREISEVERSSSGRYAFEIDAADLRQSGSGTVPITVVLMDRDAIFDDEIRSWSTRIEVGTDSTASSSDGIGDSQSTTPSQQSSTRTTVTTSEVRNTTTPAARTATTADSPTRTATTSTVRTPTTSTVPTPTTSNTQTPTTRTTRTTTPTTAAPTTTTETGSERSSYTVTVVEVVDGDTARIEYQNGSTDTVRLLGVDTPEVHIDNHPAEFENVPNTEAGADCLRDWGHKASEFARTELYGEQVTLTFDESEGRRGSYGRLLVYVHHDGELFNYRLVTQGYARMYDSDFTKRSRFSSAESPAQRNSVGLWDCTDVATETTTTTESSSGGSGSLSVVEIYADASGNDHENLNGEYVVFKNTGDETLDLSGWVLEDEADHTFYFPDEFALDPGQTVTVYTGSGSNSESEVYWGSGSAVWNNGGDTIIVRDASGNVVVRKEYSG